LTLDTFIPNDVAMAGGFVPSDDISTEDETSSNSNKSILLVTGPNGAGKSILCKTIALVVILAQVGSFVPCDNAVIGLCDAIFTRVATQESASKAASAFLIDCNQVSFALRNSTSRSLLIMDEFGKGTEANDGTGLFAGLLTHLAGRGVGCPKVILTSHFQQIFSLQDYPIPRDYINQAHMSLLALPGKTGDDLTFTFRLRPGLLQSSYAAQCAELHGIPKAVCDRAIQLTLVLETGALPGADTLKMTEEEQEVLARAEVVTRRFLEAAFDENPRQQLEAVFSF
jgi:DNA mismatch repair protein MSH5